MTKRSSWPNLLALASVVLPRASIELAITFNKKMEVIKERKREKEEKARKKEKRGGKERKRKRRREKDVQGKLLSICIQFAKRKTRYISRNAQNFKKWRADL